MTQLHGRIILAAALIAVAISGEIGWAVLAGVIYLIFNVKP